LLPSTGILSSKVENIRQLIFLWLPEWPASLKSLNEGLVRTNRIRIPIPTHSSFFFIYNNLGNYQFIRGQIPGKFRVKIPVFDFERRGIFKDENIAVTNPDRKMGTDQR
jgi:hypothetical protein